MLEDPVRFELITSIALAERKQGTDTAMYSATRGLLWLVRCAKQPGSAKCNSPDASKRRANT